MGGAAYGSIGCVDAFTSAVRLISGKLLEHFYPEGWQLARYGPMLYWKEGRDCNTASENMAACDGAINGFGQSAFTDEWLWAAAY